MAVQPLCAKGGAALLEPLEAGGALRARVMKKRTWNQFGTTASEPGTPVTPYTLSHIHTSLFPFSAVIRPVQVAIWNLELY